MSLRLSPVAALVLVFVAACASDPGSTAEPSAAPDPTPITWPGYAPDPSVTPSPDAGNVDGAEYPELTIESLADGALRATIVDPVAKAWRLVVAGVGGAAGDRLEVLVETGDVEPSILVTEIADDLVIDEMDLSGYADGTAAAGGCHRTLEVCVDSDGFRLPADGDGTFSVRLVQDEAGSPLTVTGGTATWPGEPFILGPWTDAEPFAWGNR